MNDENLKPFKKGYDPRRNVKGVPKDVLELRRLAKQVLAEQLEMPDKKKVRRLVAMLRRMTSANNPKAWEDVIKLAYPGALVDNVDLTSGGEKIIVKVGIDPDKV